MPRARRAGRVTAPRLARIAGGMAIATVLVVTAMVSWSLLRASDPDASLPLPEGHVLGDMTGQVGEVNRDAQTVDISETPPGLRPVTLVVTDDTSITVHGKQGGLGDLGKDMPVRVFYEVRDEVMYATSIQVVTEDAQASQPTVSDRVAAETTPPAVPVAPPPAPVTPAPAAGPLLLPPASPPPPPPAPAASSGTTQVRGSPPAKPPRAAAPTTEAPSVSPPRAPAPPPAEAEPDYGMSAIDWLLKESGRH